jgi:hypothetical protein
MSGMAFRIATSQKRETNRGKEEGIISKITSGL